MGGVCFGELIESSEWFRSVCVLYELIELMSTIFGTLRTKVTEFKERLIAARERAGMTQTGLGEVCDMAGTQISRYEAGRAVPRRAAMQRLANALGVTYEWLAKGEGREKQMQISVGAPAGEFELVLRADAITRENFLALAAEAKVPPEIFLANLVADHAMKVHDKYVGGDERESGLDKVMKRLEELEARLDGVQPQPRDASAGPLPTISIKAKPKARR